MRDKWRNRRQLEPAAVSAICRSGSRRFADTQRPASTVCTPSHKASLHFADTARTDGFLQPEPLGKRMDGALADGYEGHQARSRAQSPALNPAPYRDLNRATTASRSVA
jgi:hypothetical protein